jgi:hypothetical protein
MKCGQCHGCLASNLEIPWPPLRMVVCVKCGNKRCPHATDCALACTGSNEPGQKGSVWDGYKVPGA